MISDVPPNPIFALNAPEQKIGTTAIIVRPTAPIKMILLSTLLR